MVAERLLGLPNGDLQAAHSTVLRWITAFLVINKLADREAQTARWLRLAVRTVESGADYNALVSR